MNEKIVKKTQDSLGKIIKKPPMTEKLLSKPPFRFLHDVMTSVIKQTGVMKGLFTEEEMNSENVKDKDSKVAFLQKAIDLVTMVTGKSIAARPSKVVAGHEPEKTNEFLQLLAEAISSKPDNDAVVKKVLSGDKEAPSKPEKPPAGTRKEKEKEKDADKERGKDKAKEGVKGKEGDKDERRKRRDKEKEDDKRNEKDDDRKPKRRESVDRGERSKERDKSRPREGSSRDRERDSAKDGKDRDKSRSRDKDRTRDKGEKEEGEKEKRRRHRDREKDEDKENEENMMNGDKDDEPPKKSREKQRKSSAITAQRGEADEKEEEEQHRQDREKDERREREKKEGPQTNGDAGEEGSSAPRRLARPSSARPAPPRVKKNDLPPEEPHIVGSAAPNVIVDKNDDSDDEGFITKEEEVVEPEPDAPLANGDDDEDADHGGLVKKILETKKELEGGSQANRHKKTEIERSAPVNDAAKRKEREQVQKEIDRLRSSIQTLTRSANPLGKIMDFIQEDLDQMQKELEVWKIEHKENTIALQREQSITESSIEPLRAQLTEIDQAIADQVDLIAAVKSNILRNDDRTEKMLSTVTKS